MEKMLDAKLLGIGSLLRQFRFGVPTHQRPYAWLDEQVNDLYRDLHDGLKRRTEEYFLGTVVLADADDSRLSIIDGQQRLVTVSILIGAIRDYFAKNGQRERAEDIEKEYLCKRDIRTQEETPYLYLTPEDREFFINNVVRPPKGAASGTAATTEAQHRISRAIDLAAKFVQNLTSTTQTPDDILLDLLEFIEKRALLIFVRVGDEANAYVIFEVLNDRGLDLSIADLLKNYILRQAGDRLSEAQVAWQTMISTIAEVAGEGDVPIFIRHAWIAKHGLTREKELYDAIKRHVSSKARAIEYVKELAAVALDYAALRNSNSERWNAYGEAVADAIEAFDTIGVTQIRPLLLALFKNFTSEEVKKALPMTVCWTVRFLICGSGGSGTLEKYYAERAKEVSNGSIKTAQQLWTPMKGVLPSDAIFEEAFAVATVSKGTLAKFYLRMLEQYGIPGGELTVSQDSEKVNLEHILPQTHNPANWPHIPADQHPGLVKRLGNLALLNKRLNSKAANSDFATKKAFFRDSKISLTSQLDKLPDWTPAAIEKRQRELAKLAVKVWPNKPRP